MGDKRSGGRRRSCCLLTLLLGLVVTAGLIVLGDNRGNAADSRTWGQLPLVRVQGRVQAIVWHEGAGPVWETSP